MNVLNVYVTVQFAIAADVPCHAVMGSTRQKYGVIKERGETMATYRDLEEADSPCRIGYLYSIEKEEVGGSTALHYRKNLMTPDWVLESMSKNSAYWGKEALDALEMRIKNGKRIYCCCHKPILSDEADNDDAPETINADIRTTLSMVKQDTVAAECNGDNGAKA